MVSHNLHIVFRNRLLYIFIASHIWHPPKVWLALCVKLRNLNKYGHLSMCFRSTSEAGKGDLYEQS